MKPFPAPKGFQGLYQIKGKNATAAFEVQNGMVTACAPILRELLQRYDKDRWFARAVRVAAVDLNEKTFLDTE